MKKLVVVANDLEASGKSTAVRAIARHLADQEIQYSIVTSDEQDVNDFFEGDYWDFNEQIELSQVIHVLDRNEAVILDVQSGMARVWSDFCEEQELDVLLGELDVEMTLVIPANASERSNEEVADLAQMFSDQADYVIAHTSMEAQGSREVAWKGSEAAKAVKYLGAMEIRLPEVDSDLATALESSDLELGTAIDRLSEIPRFLEVQVCQWLESCSEQLAATDDYLIPEDAGALIAH